MPATVLLTSGASLDVRMWDLGTDGASLVSPKPITQGSMVELRFEVPAAAGTTSAAAAKAKVVYSSYMGPAQFRIGVLFAGLDDASAAAIDGFVA
jgi:hypothetical protein